MTILEKAKSYNIFKIETANKFFGGKERYTDKEMKFNDFSKEEMKDWEKCDFVITEKCDDYYHFPLTKEELEQLGNELIELSKG